MSQDQLGLFDTPPERRQIRFAIAIVGLLFAALLLILPVRDIRLGQFTAFVPMIDAFMFLSDLIVATLFYAQATVFRSRSLNVLASTYIFMALLLIPHALTFPGAFAPDGLLGAGINTTGWCYMFRRAAFPVAIIVYVLLNRAGSSAQPRMERPPARIAAGVFAAIALAAAVTVLVTFGHDLLPPLFLNRRDTLYANFFGTETVLIALSIVAMAVLYRQCKSVLDMWLLVALSGWLVQSLLNLTLGSRFTAGWYCLYAVTLFSYLVVMLALIAESNRLYGRLALSTLARDRERDARLMSMEAVAAAISHEVGQPLTAVVTNAMGGLSWLTREQPDPEKAIKALRATIEAGRHATDVIKSIRAMFAKGPGAASEFSLNDLVRETTALLARELSAGKISLQLALDEALPPIMADRVQMERVLVNLFTNAIESLGTTRGRPCRIAIRSMPADGEKVLLEVSDTGTGIAPDEMPHIFDAFFTTKAKGTGMGLSLCRSIVEEHGGRLWATPGEDYGATFHLQLPRSALASTVTISNHRDDGNGRDY